MVWLELSQSWFRVLKAQAIVLEERCARDILASLLRGTVQAIETKLGKHGFGVEEFCKSVACWLRGAGCVGRSKGQIPHAGVP